MAKGKILIVYQSGGSVTAQLKTGLETAGWETAILPSVEPSALKIITKNSYDALVIDAGLLQELAGSVQPSFDGREGSPAVFVLISSRDEGVQELPYRPFGCLDDHWAPSLLVQTLETGIYYHNSLISAQKDLLNTKNLMSRCPALIYRCSDYPAGIPDYVGGACESVTGFAPDEMRSGKVSFAALIAEEDRRMVENSLYLRMSRKLPFELEYRIRDKEGRVRWIRDSGAGVFSYDGILLYVEGYWQDITEPRMLG